jgi:TPR repeat protein
MEPRRYDEGYGGTPINNGPQGGFPGQNGRRSEEQRQKPSDRYQGQGQAPNTAPTTPQQQHFPRDQGPPSQQGIHKSQTMPQNVNMHDQYSQRRPQGQGQNQYPQDPRWQQPGNSGAFYGADSGQMPPRPSTAGGTRPNVQRNNSDPRYANGPMVRAPPLVAAPTPVPEAIPYEGADVIDSYYGEDSYSQAGPYDGHTRGPSQEEMPNFDAVEPVPVKHRPGKSIDVHLPAWNASQAPAMPAMPNAHQDAFASQAHKSRSQPDLRGQAGQAAFIAEMPGDIPPVPVPQVSQYPASARVKQMPPMQQQNGFAAQNYPANQQDPRGNGHPPPGPNGYPQPQRISPQAQGQYMQRPPTAPLPRPGTAQSMAPSVAPSIANSAYSENPYMNSRGPGPNGVSPGSSVAPSVAPPINPDALPAMPLLASSHPPPIRAGLIPGSVAQQSHHPAPVRQYAGSTNGTSPQPPNSNGAARPASGSQAAKRESVAITYDELERLRAQVKANPTDQKLALHLSKKLVEAAVVLSDDGGRADAKTRNRNREKYIFDAHKLIKKLVNAGNQDAMFYLADCYGKGSLGLEPDQKEAFTLYQSAAKLGHAQAAYRTAVCCEMGSDDGGGTKRDPLKAIQWYKRAASMGDVPAMYKMGMIGLKGLLGQPKNGREAVSWLKRAAERADEENPHALHELGLVYEGHAELGGSIVRDEGYSFELFQRAANLGYKFSQFRLGCSYEYGSLGCTISPRDSIMWYSKAAVQGEHQSELALSGWYLTGSEGVLAQSDTEAYLWARKAALAGLAKAEYAMGYFTEVGIGCPKSMDEAKRWYYRAAGKSLLSNPVHYLPSCGKMKVDLTIVMAC